MVDKPLERNSSLDNVEQFLRRISHIPMKGVRNSMTQITVNLPYDEKERFAKLAAKNDIAMSQLIRWFIRNLIREDTCGFTLRIEQ